MPVLCGNVWHISRMYYCGVSVERRDIHIGRLVFKVYGGIVGL